MLALLSPRLWLALAIAAVIAGILAFAYHLGGLNVQHKWDVERIAQEAARAELEMKSRQREQALVTLMEINRKEKAREVKNILDQHDALVRGLLSRPDRPAGDATSVAPVGQAPAGCTGAELYRPDAEFSAGEAARADQLRVELKTCYSAYDNARETLNQFTTESKP